MKISVRADTARMERKLGKLKTQVPFAASRAINDTLASVRSEEQNEIVRKIDRPTPNTVEAYRIQFSNKRRLFGFVELKRNAKYLTGLISGGSEGGKHPVPGKSEKLNQYGNLPRRATKGSKVFYKKLRNGAEGHWRTVGSGKNRRLQMVAHWPGSRSYSPSLDFYGVAQRTVNKWFPVYFRKRIADAVLTAI